LEGSLHHIQSLEIAVGEMCSLLGVSPTSGRVYCEVVNDERVTLYEYAVSSAQLQAPARNSRLYYDDLPTDLIAPQVPTQTTWLNHTGLRWRGMRETDRVVDWVLPLTIMEKMQILPHVGIQLTPMQLLGVAESQILSEAKLNDDGAYLVCRRLRLAYALAQPQHDENGPYDYDTILCHVVHCIEGEQEPSWESIFTDFDREQVKAPIDCLFHEDKIYIADSGTPSIADAAMCSLHVWQFSS
jgi:hypothetical protein